MNILTDEELESIKFDQRDQLVDLETLRAVESAVLAKLAALDVKPIYQLCKANSSLSSAWIDVDEQTYIDAGLYQEYGRRCLYTEALLLSALAALELLKTSPNIEIWVDTADEAITAIKEFLR